MGAMMAHELDVTENEGLPSAAFRAGVARLFQDLMDDRAVFDAATEIYEAIWPAFTGCPKIAGLETPQLTRASITVVALLYAIVSELSGNPQVVTDHQLAVRRQFEHALHLLREPRMCQ